METVKQSARAVTSKPVQRAVVNTVLVVCGGVSLFCFAAIASLLFFQNFVPDQFVTTPVYLQYGSSSHPYGVAALPASRLKSKQDYQISVTLTLPRSPANLDRGNFMIKLYLLSSSSSSSSSSPSSDTRIEGVSALDASALKFAASGGSTVAAASAAAAAGFEGHEVLFHSRRPTLIPYVDPMVSVASRTLLLLYHMVFPSSQTCTMVVPLAEHVEFARDSRIPAAVYVEVEAGQGIQIYSTVLTMTAQFHGLRYLMFHYRLPTFLTFTSLFWVCAFIFMAASFATYSLRPGAGAGAGAGARRGKGQGPRLGRGGEDDDDDSEDGGDYHQQHGLSEDEQSVSPEEGQTSSFPRGEVVAAKKEEEDDDEGKQRRSLADIPMIGGGAGVGAEAEADDEDEDGDGDEHEGRVHATRASGSGHNYGEHLRRRLSRGVEE